MRYSLLSRFQGALLGAVLGDEVSSYQRQLRSQGTKADLHQWRPDLGRSLSSDPSLVTVSWQGKEAITWTKTLLRYGSLNRLAAHWPDALDGKSERFSANRTTGEMAIATLPLMLFCHDSAIKLRQSLELAIDPSQEERLGHLFIVGCVIAQLLQEQWQPLALLPQTLSKLRQAGFSLTVQQKLTASVDRVQQCLQQRLSLSQATAVLTATEQSSEFGAIALAFYCFLSAPDHFALALLRAAQVDCQPATVAALTGTLVGVHNSVIDIPLEWLVTLIDANQPLIWGVSGVEIQTLATRLLASWSGMYDATDESTPPPIAAPGVIRPR
jgi:hypothetical protein